MPSLIKAYEDGTLALLQAEERAHNKELPLVEIPVDADGNLDCNDDDECEPFCGHCQNMGFVNCYCGGDLCVCDNNGEQPCPSCHRAY